MSYLYEVAGPIAESDAAWPCSAREQRRLVDDLLPLLEHGLVAACTIAGKPIPDPEPLLEAFLPLYADRPMPTNKGGSGLNDSLWLWMLARSLAPEVIVESGTWRGHSAWLFRQACPDATIATFDLEVPSGGRHEEPSVTYSLQDWSESGLTLPRGLEGLVFFDDHVSQARRLREAAERGFRLALFDDNFPAHQLHATGAPPVPTLAMLADPALSSGGAIEWQRNGKRYRYRDQPADSPDGSGAVLGLIEAQVTLPELAAVTRHPPGSGMTLVRISQ